MNSNQGRKLSPQVRRWEAALLADEVRLAYLTEKRAISLATITAHRVGWIAEEGRYAFPVVVGNSVVNVRRYNPGANDRKTLNTPGCGTGTRLNFTKSITDKNDWVLVAGGETDALAAISAGFAAVSGTNGEGSVPTPESLAALEGCRVALVLDSDPPGRKASARWAAKLESVAAEVRDVLLPVKDVNDYLAGGHGDELDLTVLIDKAVPPGERRPAQDLVQLAVDKASAGHSRNDAGFWLACQLRDERYDETDAWTSGMAPYQQAVTATKGEPYTSEEARVSMESAYSEAARDPSGATSPDDMLAKAVEAERYKAKVRREARRLDDADAAGAAFEGFAGASLDVALKQTPNESPWLIEGLMRVGHKVGLVAGFKTGKTTLLGNVARSLVDGVRLFDRFDVADVGGSMVVFDFELVTGDAVDMYHRLDIAHPDRVFVESLRGQRFSLANDVHAEMVVKFLHSRETAIWALDPFARAMSGFGSADDNNDVGAFLERVDQIVSEAGVKGVLIPAHTGRGQAEVGTEHSRGATRFDDDVDARWIYTRDGSQQRFFRAEGRNGVGGFAEFAVRFDAARDALTASSDTRKSVAATKNAEAAYRVVKEWKPGPTAEDPRPNRNDVYKGMPRSDRQTNQVGVDEAIRFGWLTEEKLGRGRAAYLSLGEQSPIHRKIRPKLASVPDNDGEAS